MIRMIRMIILRWAANVGGLETAQWDVGEAAGLPDVLGAQNVIISTVLAPDGVPLSSLRDLP